jgi:iron complex transport system substrate-binding protein
MQWKAFVVLGASLLAAASSTLAAPGFPATIRDDVGTEVEIKRWPERVVCLSPGATEIIYAIGAGNRLKAVCGLCDFPPPARLLPRAGDFLSVNAESVMGARPNLVVATGGVQKELVLRLRASRIPVLVLYPHSVGGIRENILMLGRALGVEAQAAKVAGDFGSRIAAVTTRAKMVRPGSRKRVYFEIAPDPQMAASDRGYLGEMIFLAGGRNVVSSDSEEYPRISPELVISRDPEVIIVSHAADSAEALRMLKARPGWGNVSAVRNGRVYADINMDLVMRPGPRVAAGLATIFSRIYPGR